MADYSGSPINLLAVFNALPGAYLLLSPDFIIEAANDAYLEMTLTQRENLVGRPLFAVFPDHPQAPGINNLRLSLEQVLSTGLPHEMARHQYDLPDPDNPGQYLERYWSLGNTPVLDEAGRIRHIIHAVVNVTDSVKTERSLQQSQQREQQAQLVVQEQLITHREAEARQAAVLASLQRRAQERETFYQIFAQTPAAICIQRGPEHRYEYFNAAYQQFFPDRQLLGRTVTEALPETVPAGFVALLDRVYQTSEPYFGYESPLLLEQPNGGPAKEMFFTFTYQAFREKGMVVGISTFAYDVTEQVLIRRQRDLQQQQLRELFEQAPVAIAVLRGSDYVIEVANPLVAALWGRSPDQVLGKPLLQALPEVRDQGFRELLDEVVKTGTPYVAREVVALLPRKHQLEKVYLDFVYHPLRDEQGHITSVAAVATDVSEQVVARKQLHRANQELTASVAQLDQANQQLTRINLDLDNFIYTASHDLKTPILNIEGLMEVLLEQLPAESLQLASVQQTTHLILNSVQRFKRTINHLTEITKLQKENSPTVTPVNLAALIEEVQMDLAPLIQVTQARVEVEVSRCPVINFSEKNLRSIIYNLLSNALKYHSPDRLPLVKITCQTDEEYQVISVQDNGLGISLAQQPKLFSMFKRFHDHVEGSGIGLYIVKRIIENAGGEIEVQSRVAEGSIFQVFFPRKS